MLLDGLCRRGPQVEGEHPGAIRLIHNCFRIRATPAGRAAAKCPLTFSFLISTADKLAVEKL